MLRSFLIIGLWLVTLVGGAQTSAPDWHSDRAAGDKYFKEFHLAKAAACYERALEDPAIKDSIEAQLVILRHVMDCYGQMGDADNLTQGIFRLRKLAEEHGNKAFEAISYATSGRWHHYNGQKADGNYGKMIPDNGDDKHGHITINISGGNEAEVTGSTNVVVGKKAN